MFLNLIKFFIAFSLIASVPFSLSAANKNSEELSPSGTPHTSSALCSIHDSVNSHSMGRSNSQFCNTNTNLNNDNLGNGNIGNDRRNKGLPTHLQQPKQHRSTPHIKPVRHHPTVHPHHARR